MIRRHLEPILLESLGAFPAVLVTGARQVGKSTLAEALCRQRWKAEYLTLDKRVNLDAALEDPDGFIEAHPGPVAIDEVQKAPDLLRAVKFQVDRRRTPGRFLLTGSANVITLKRVSETLAGRIALHELHPFSISELSRQESPPALLQKIFQGAELRSLVQELGGKRPTLKKDLPARILQGGYPTPALMTQGAMRARWFEAYRKTYIQRDVRELQAIERLSDFERLMILAASRTGQILNLADLGREVGLPYVTLRRYMNILEQTYQTFLVPPYFSNASKRMTKAPKLYWTDTGMACHLWDLRDPAAVERHPRFGALLESWVACELQKLLSLSPEPMRLYGWRLQTGQEVDFLIEKGGRFLALEVKWAGRADPSVFNLFHRLERQFGDRFLGGVLLYGGAEAVPWSARAAAVPLSAFFLA